MGDLNREWESQDNLGNREIILHEVYLNIINKYINEESY
jgi:hypothetical protein